MTFPILGGNSAVATYSIDNSLRFNSGDNAHLSKTPSASNRDLYTISLWAKRSNLNTGARQVLFGVGNPATTSQVGFEIRFDNNVGDGKLRIGDYVSGVTDYVFLVTDAIFRDVSAWYHILYVYDSSQATNTDRTKLYVNGNQITNFSSSTYPNQNQDSAVGSNTKHLVGMLDGNAHPYNGYLAEINYIDGQALSPTDFGEFDEDSGIWKPIRYSGSYGTNGFYLDFENSGSLGADQSGNGNDFTPTNLASTDQTTDTPTNNFATLNPLSDSGATLSEGNTQGVGSPSSATSTIAPTSGKWYVEFQNSALQNSSIGLVNLDAWASTTDIYPYAQASAVLIESNANYNVTYGNTASSPTTLQTGTQYNASKYGFAFDLDNGNVYVSADGNWYGGSDFNQAIFSNAVAVTTDIPTNTPMAFFTRGSFGSAYYVNFGNPPPSYSISSGNSDDNGYGNFEYAPPSGYLALCTQNLATELSPTIDDGSEYFNTVLYSGTSTTDRTVTGIGFQPDFTWFKGRTPSAIDHALFDSNRGATKILSSNNANVEITVSESLKSFDSDGVTLGNDLGDYGVNNSARTYALWSWKSNAGSTSSNTDGSITSTVQANTTAGFSIVTYTGTGSVATVGHGLGKAPAMMIFKNRDAGGNYWRVYHQSLGATKNLVLNGTFAQLTETAKFNDTEPTSSVFTVGTDNDTNASSQNILSYCFAEIEGYSKFGSYTGNGSTDGTFVYTGHKSQWLLIKNVEQAGGQWFIYDVKRETFNPLNSSLFAESSQAETANNSALDIDILSNGWKIRNTGSGFNNSGIKYIYASFASNPFVSSTGIPVTAR
jgi:hypothetical protein